MTVIIPAITKRPSDGRIHPGIKIGDRCFYLDTETFVEPKVAIERSRLLVEALLQHTISALLTGNLYKEYKG